MDTEELKQEVKKYTGDNGDEIIEAVRQLAEIDVQIKNSLDEIEKINEELPPKHNELADKINTMIKEVCEEKPEPEPEKEPEQPKQKPEIKVQVHVMPVRTIMRTPCMPLSLRLLLDFLNS